MDAVTLSLIKSLSNNGGSGSLPPVTSSNNGKVLGVVEGEWTMAGELQTSNNVIIRADVEQDGSLLAAGTIDYSQVLYLFNRGCLFVGIYRNDSFEQTVKCDFATDIGDGLSWIFRGNYLDILSGKPKTISVHFTPPQSPDSTPASITIINMDANNKFIVTLTPTALDYSGTMDKTIAEINAAYEAGKDIWFSISVGAATLNAKLAIVTDINAGNPMFTFYAIDTNNNVLIVGYNNSYTDDGDTYGTTVYSLTPAS